MTDVVKRLEMLRDFVGRTTADTIDDAISEIFELRAELVAARRRERGRCAQLVFDMIPDVRRRETGLPADPFAAVEVVLEEAFRAIDALGDDE